MPDIVITVLSFLVAIAVLVAVHEYGHFQVARWCGVKVLRFSVGFGKPLWSRRGKDGVEYVIAAIPLGGYVKMLDRRETDVAEEDLPREFMAQPIWKRNAIVVAGPLANFIFAVFAYWAAFVWGIPGQAPVIGEVAGQTPAAVADIRENDRLVSIDGETVSTWEAVSLALVRHSVDASTVPVTLLRADRDIHTILDLSSVDIEPENLFRTIGIEPWRPVLPAVINDVVDGGPASNAGFQTGDRVIGADETVIETWQQWVAYVQQRPGKAIDITVLRGQRESSLVLIPGPHPDAGAETGYAGVTVQVPETLKAELESQRAVMRLGPAEALWAGAKRTWDMSVLTVKMFGKMIVGEASLKNVGGPVHIAQYTGMAASVGLTTFLSVLALVSIGLGVINLLPIPVLDGGHLLYYCAEFIKGSPVSERTQQLGQTIGLAAIMALMSLAFYNDFTRLFG